MDRFTSFLFVFVSTLGFAKEPNPAPVYSHAAITPALDVAVEDLLDDGSLAGGVTLVAQGGEVIHLQAHGLRNLETKEPMTTDTIFRIHSMTKAIVSAAALQQLEQGKFKLSDPVADFIPAFATPTVKSGKGDPKPASRTMTVEDLFRHTSGIAYGFTAPPRLAREYASLDTTGSDLESFCNQLAKIPLAHEPGESWTYGLSTDVLGRLVEIWSGMPLDEYLEKEFFTPLGMSDTGFWIDSESELARFAPTNQTTPDGIAPGNDPLGQKYLTKPRMISGGGGLVSTARDYYRFLQMIVNGGRFGDRIFLKPETVALMTSDRLPESIPNIFFGTEQRTDVGFGLGFSVVKGPSTDWDPDAALGEYGWGGAASCHYWISPKDDDLIVITLEQTVPYNWNMERALKPVIYEALR